MYIIEIPIYHISIQAIGAFISGDLFKIIIIIIIKTLFSVGNTISYKLMQLTLAILTSLISNNRLS